MLWKWTFHCYLYLLLISILSQYNIIYLHISTQCGLVMSYGIHGPPLSAPSHYLKQCWFLIGETLWHSPASNSSVNDHAIILYNKYANQLLKWVKHQSQYHISSHSIYNLMDIHQHWYPIVWTPNSCHMLVSMVSGKQPGNKCGASGSSSGGQEAHHNSSHYGCSGVINSSKRSAANMTSNTLGFLYGKVSQQPCHNSPVFFMVKVYCMFYLQVMGSKHNV